MQPKIVIASRNPAKLALFQPAISAFGLDCLGLNEAGLAPLAVDENGRTPEANALLKARAYWRPGTVTFADDSGMEVDALGGEPGVQARRWNGRFADDIDDDTWLNYLLGRLQSVPLEQRTARFVSGWALVSPDGTAETRKIVTPFLIAEQRIRPMTPGFPMSAVQIRLDQSDPNRLEQRVAQELQCWEFFRSLVGQDLLRGQPGDTIRASFA